MQPIFRQNIICSELNISLKFSGRGFHFAFFLLPNWTLKSNMVTLTCYCHPRNRKTQSNKASLVQEGSKLLFCLFYCHLKKMQPHLNQQL